MLAGSLIGLIVLTLGAPAAGDRAPVVARPDTGLRIIDVASRDTYRMLPNRRLAGPVDAVTMRTRSDLMDTARDRRFDRALAVGRTAAADPGTDSLKTLLRDRMARRGGALDAKVEWRLTGQGSDVGLAGGLKRVVDTLLND